MINVGIDIAKLKHDACILNQFGEALAKPFTFTNNLECFNQIEEASTRRMDTILSKASRNRFKKAQAIKDLAHISIGIQSQALSFELIQVIELLNFQQQQIDSLDKELRKIVEKMHSPLLSIPGIGFRLAAIILTEIGNIKAFESPDKLLAFAGLDPSTFQSGQYSARKTPQSKRGSTYLRWALIQAAQLCSRHCPILKAFKKRKMAQGKHHFVALGHVSKKLVRMIFHLLSTGDFYSNQAA